ncbi:hypothetical protein J1N35_022073 [Gossypium stocksii]|uniref:Uncharacterized protein n=1 Tax=Gossypium stocksii TaxID=47602 RepID=A0A9D4A2F7_9ROSI|nr:hypothetical protein J1N35_022073 [Gossypium stocksii]
MDENHKSVVANLTKSHEEVMEQNKKGMIENLDAYLLDLKANFLLHAQIVVGFLDARRVKFDALSKLRGTQLDFDVYFPSKTTWEDFTTKWKNSPNFYIVDVAETRYAFEDPIDNSVIPTDGNEDNECKENDRPANFLSAYNN